VGCLGIRRIQDIGEAVIGLAGSHWKLDRKAHSTGASEAFAAPEPEPARSLRALFSGALDRQRTTYRQAPLIRWSEIRKKISMPRGGSEYVTAAGLVPKKNMILGS